LPHEEIWLARRLPGVQQTLPAGQQGRQKAAESLSGPAIVVVLVVAFLTTLVAGPAVAVAAIMLRGGTLVATAIVAPLIAVAAVHAAIPGAGRQAQQCDDGTENSNSKGGTHGACSCMNEVHTMARAEHRRRWATAPTQRQ
jgi:hypothetical protein